MEDEKTEISKMMRKKEADEIRVPLKFVREAVKTDMMLGGKNVSDFDQKTLKMVSPRIMSIVPEQEDESLVGFLFFTFLMQTVMKGACFEPKISLL